MVDEVKKPWQHPPIRSPVTGESGKWESVAGRDVFIPNASMDPDEIGQDELNRWEHPAPSYRSADSEPDKNPNEEIEKQPENPSGTHVIPQSSRTTPESSVNSKLFGDPVEELDKDGSGDARYGNQHETGMESEWKRPINSETYIGSQQTNSKKMTDMNKIKNTRVGDDIHFYINGKEGRGIVAKMGNSYIQVFKEDGSFSDIHINDTFFVKDIIVNKTWDNMDSTERYEALSKIHAPTPRFISKSWDQLPKEITELLTKTGFTYETGHSKDSETEDHSRTGSQQNTQYDEDIKDKDSTGRAGSGIGRNARFGGGQENKSTVNVWKPIPDGKGGKGSFDDCEAANQDKNNPGAYCGSMQNEVEGKNKSDVEDTALGNVGGRPFVGISGNVSRQVDAPEDYEGQTHDDKDEEFKHEQLKPETKDAEYDPATGKKKDDGASTGDSAGFNAIYGQTTGKPGTDQKYGDKKSGMAGVPDYNVNTWGINYTKTKKEEDKENDTS